MTGSFNPIYLKFEEALLEPLINNMTHQALDYYLHPINPPNVNTVSTVRQSPKRLYSDDEIEKIISDNYQYGYDDARENEGSYNEGLCDGKRTGMETGKNNEYERIDRIMKEWYGAHSSTYQKFVSLTKKKNDKDIPFLNDFEK